MPTFELDETKEVVLPASKEVAAIEEMRNEIAEFMAPALEEEIDKAITEAKAIVTVTDEAGKEIAKSHATILQKARTQKVEKPHKKFKAPVTAISSALDGRKRTLSEKLEAEEGRVRALISEFDRAEELKAEELKRQHREKIQGRINDAIKAGVQVDTDFAELASDDEWAAELRVAVEKKAKQDEVASMVSRAAAQGFVLPADDIEHMDLLIAAGELANREAGLMVWLADAVKARTKQEAALRTERRMAQLEELGIEAGLKAIRELGDAEWDALVAAALVPAEVPAVASEPVLHADAPSPVAQACVATSEPPAPADTDERLARQAGPVVFISDKAPAIEVLKKLAGFGKKHCSEKGELRTDFVEIFQAMKAYVEAL